MRWVLAAHQPHQTAARDWLQIPIALQTFRTQSPNFQGRPAGQHPLPGSLAQGSVERSASFARDARLIRQGLSIPQPVHRRFHRQQTGVERHPPERLPHLQSHAAKEPPDRKFAGRSRRQPVILFEPQAHSPIHPSWRRSIGFLFARSSLLAGLKPLDGRSKLKTLPIALALYLPNDALHQSHRGFPPGLVKSGSHRRPDQPTINRDWSRSRLPHPIVLALQKRDTD